MGKCGFGSDVIDVDCFCPVPTKVLVGSDNRRVRKLSCGTSHSAVITDNFQLFVFGCGDGGRLGMGEGRFDTLDVPTLVDALLHERITSVSCGNTTTLAV